MRRHSHTQTMKHKSKPANATNVPTHNHLRCSEYRTGQSALDRRLRDNIALAAWLFQRAQ
jgi:hypothetical protein